MIWFYLYVAIGIGLGLPTLILLLVIRHNDRKLPRWLKERMKENENE